MMQKRKAMILGGMAGGLIGGVMGGMAGGSAGAGLGWLAGKAEPLATVPHVDLSRYLGRWYEIARYPNLFQRKCDRDITAEYALAPRARRGMIRGMMRGMVRGMVQGMMQGRAQGKITVLNSCTKRDGSVEHANGVAVVVDPLSNAKLKVTFSWPFAADYWIIDLGANYEYAVVGEPSRRNLWILSRSPQMSDSLYEQILRTVAARGYNPKKLVRTRQSAALAA